MYLSTILDDLSRHIIAWKLCTTKETTNVTDTLQLALTASGGDQAHVRHKPWLLSDDGSSYVSRELADCSAITGWGTCAERHIIPGRSAGSNARTRR